MADRFPYDIHQNPTFLGMMAFQDSVWRLARNEQKLVLAGGGTGIGKTFLLRHLCRRCGIKDVPEERPQSVDSLASYFWLYREHPVVALDECDHLFRQEATINLLKIANGEPRVVAHATKEAIRNEQYLKESSKRYRESVAPTRFPLGDKARQALLSNENYQDPEVTAKLPQVHWAALVGRGLDPIWIPTEGNDGRDLFEYTHWLATSGKMLRSLQFTWDVSRQAIAFWLDNIHRLVDINPRRVVFIAQVFRDFSDREKRMSRLNQMLRDTDQRPKLIVPSTWVPGLYLPRHPPPSLKPQARLVPRPQRVPNTAAANRELLPNDPAPEPPETPAHPVSNPDSQPDVEPKPLQQRPQYESGSSTVQQENARLTSDRSPENDEGASRADPVIDAVAVDARSADGPGTDPAAGAKPFSFGEPEAQVHNAGVDLEAADAGGLLRAKDAAQAPVNPQQTLPDLSPSIAPGGDESEIERRLQARQLDGVRLGTITDDEAARIEQEMIDWEDRLRSSHELATVRGRGRAGVRARVLRMRFGKAVEAIQRELGALGDVDPAFSVRSAAWWCKHGDGTVGFILFKAPEQVAKEAARKDKNISAGNDNEVGTDGGGVQS